MENQFTYTYSQPPNYRFCQDSILFPHFVAQTIRERVNKDSRVLDVCAGCGVVGFELQYHLPVLRQIEFLEVQDEFAPHFARNCEITGRSEFKFLRLNYGALSLPEFSEQYDFIVGNPPYFFIGEGKTPPDRLKYRARFFADESFEALIEGLMNSLRPDGEAYLLIKAGLKHGRNSLAAIQNLIGNRGNAKLAADIRGTGVVSFTKKN